MLQITERAIIKLNSLFDRDSTEIEDRIIALYVQGLDGHYQFSLKHMYSDEITEIMAIIPSNKVPFKVVSSNPKMFSNVLIDYEEALDKEGKVVGQFFKFKKQQD